MDRNRYQFSLLVPSLTFQFKANDRVWTNFVYMVMRDPSLKQRFPCIICIAIFRAFSVEKSAHYTRVNTVFIIYPVGSPLSFQFSVMGTGTGVGFGGQGSWLGCR